MNRLKELLQRFQAAERALPRKWRLPVRYHVQWMADALEPEMSRLADLVEPDDIALDVGANRGIYAYALARIAREVHCFEPLAECCAYISAYGSPKIAVHCCALSDGPGLLELHVPLRGRTPVYTRASLSRPQGAAEVRRIEVRTLDSFGLPRVGFIKIDVEGLEAAVLRGAQQLLARDHPRLLVEIDRMRHTPETFGSLLDWLGALGYRPYVVKDGLLSPSADAWADAEAHYNFVFLPSDGRDVPA